MECFTGRKRVWGADGAGSHPAHAGGIGSQSVAEIPGPKSVTMTLTRSSYVPATIQRRDSKVVNVSLAGMK